jgi:hypothetical protein
MLAQHGLAGRPPTRRAMARGACGGAIRRDCESRRLQRRPWPRVRGRWSAFSSSHPAHRRDCPFALGASAPRLLAPLHSSAAHAPQWCARQRHPFVTLLKTITPSAWYKLAKPSRTTRHRRPSATPHAPLHSAPLRTAPLPSYPAGTSVGRQVTSGGSARWRIGAVAVEVLQPKITQPHLPSDLFLGLLFTPLDFWDPSDVLCGRIKARIGSRCC